jgi:hypothetical protein
MSRTALGPTTTPVQWVQLHSLLRESSQDVNLNTPSSSGVKNWCSYNYTSSLHLRRLPFKFIRVLLNYISDIEIDGPKCLYVCVRVCVRARACVYVSQLRTALLHCWPALLQGHSLTSSKFLYQL